MINFFLMAGNGKEQTCCKVTLLGQEENKHTFITSICKIMVAYIPLAIRQARQLTEPSSIIADVSVFLHAENNNCTFRFHNGKSPVSQTTSVHICHYKQFSQLSMMSEWRQIRIWGHKQSIKPKKSTCPTDTDFFLFVLFQWGEALFWPLF